jgi:signal transduction histidine kinase/DNA-binding NarL/FixJ family response regulator
VAAVIVAGVLTAAVPILRDRLTFFLFWPLTFALSWFLGLGPALLATALSALVVLYILPSAFKFAVDRDSLLLTVGTFWLMGTMTAVLARWREQALAQAERERRTAEAALAEAQHERQTAEAAVAEAQMARQAAETANRAKDNFLATISHELRTPLSPILAWARMLQEHRLNAEQTARALDIIERNAALQAALVEDLLDVSRIVEGKLTLEVRPVVLAEVVEQAIDTVRPAADAKNIRLQVVLDTTVAPIPGDPNRLQQVLWNLLSNAVKFTPKGGRVHVVLERVNSHVEIAVSDTGQGIPADQLPHLFERFWQADTSAGRTHKGLGLGLAIVRHLVELHGGTVVAESPGVGQGSTFTVKLPVVPVARMSGEAVRRHPIARIDGKPTTSLGFARLDGVKVLVVDDEPDTNEVVRTLLAQCGAEVRTAGSTAHALEKLEHWSPHVIVTDIGMEGEDGFALIAAVRGKPGPEGKVPMVALTAYAGVDDRVRLLAAGVQLHIAKPADPGELTAAIASLAAPLVRSAPDCASHLRHDAPRELPRPRVLQQRHVPEPCRGHRPQAEGARAARAARRAVLSQLPSWSRSCARPGRSAIGAPYLPRSLRTAHSLTRPSREEAVPGPSGPSRPGHFGDSMS